MTSPTGQESTPRWRQIQDWLRAAILDGRYPPGARIPTEHALAGHLGVNRHTVRRAVAGLVEQGLLRVEQGRGMFVQENILYYPIGRRTRFTETVERQNRSRGRRIIDTAVERADAGVADALGMLRGRAVIHLRSIAEVDGQPVSLSDDYFSKARFPEIAEHARETLSITASLRRCGIDDYFRKVTRVTTRLPRREEAEILRQPPRRPVLVTESLDVDGADRPLAFGITLWAGDRVQLAFET
jgi:GntR family transcriptional regulator, phosphonate transport system regulatory protein